MNFGKKFWFVILSFFLILGGLFAVLILVQKKQLIEKRAAVPTATLSFATTSFENLGPGDSVDTNIILNPGGQETVGVDVVIDFTKEVLELVSIDNNWAKNNTSFKTLAPITSETNCNFSLDVNAANQTGRLEFGVVTFDCETALTCPTNPPDPNCAKPTPNPPSQIINQLAWLHFRVKSNAAPGSTGTIRFYYTTAGATTDANVVPYVQPGETVDDILLEPTSVVTVTVAPAGTPTPTPTITLTPTPTPTQEPGTANLSFALKFQGINQQRPSKTVKLTLKKEGNIIKTFENVGISSDSNGIYTGRIMNIALDTYDIFTKGWAHLQRKFSNITLTEGENTQDWSGITLLAGDTNTDDKVDSLDFAILVGDYIPNTPPNSPADFDLNGQVNSLDFLFIVENYYKEGEI